MNNDKTNDIKIALFGRHYGQTTRLAMTTAQSIVTHLETLDKPIKIEFVITPTDKIKELKDKIRDLETEIENLYYESMGDDL